MKKNIILFFWTMILPIVQERLTAQMAVSDLHFRVLTEEGHPIEFANIFLPALKNGGTTDSLGRASIQNIAAGEYEVSVTFAGYFSSQKTVLIKPFKTDTLIFHLTPHMLDEVVVTGTMREIRRSESPVPVDIISSKLFLRNPTSNIFESVAMVSGVQPVLNCNVCNTGDIQINGMEGVYTQVLLDGMPIVSGLGTVYGLMGIPNSLIDRIEVVKGPAGALYGSEAMAGQINIITKNPATVPGISLDAFGTSWGEINFDAGLRLKMGNSAHGLFGINGFWYDAPMDKNGDGFTDIAQQKRISVFNKWQWKRQDQRVAQVGLRYVAEDRWGGETDWMPAFRGGDVLYGESIYTHRFEGFGQYQLPMILPVFVQASYNVHRQDSWYGNVRYDAHQEIGFLQSYIDHQAGNHHFLTGMALRYTFYDDNSTATIQPSQQLMPGIFIQDEWEVTDESHLLGGLRIDWHPEHRLIWSPRMALHRHIGENQNLRIAAGSGFRVVNLFTEDHAALSGAREVVIAERLNPERSWSVNLNYNIRIPAEKYFLVLDATAFYTRFSNKIIPDYDTDPQKIIYANLDGSAFTRGVTLQIDYSDGLPLRLNTGLTYMDVFQKNENGDKSIQIRAPKWSGTFSTSYTHPASKITFDLTGNWYGPQRLPVVPDDFRPEYAPWFALLNVQVSKKIRNGIEVYGGVKNLLNFVPKDPILRPQDPFNKEIDDPVGNPYGYTFDPSYNYAPLQGIRMFLGFRYTIK